MEKRKLAIIIDSSAGLTNFRDELKSKNPFIFENPIIIINTKTNEIIKDVLDKYNNHDVSQKILNDTEKGIIYKTSQIELDYTSKLLKELSSKFNNVYVLSIPKFISATYSIYQNISKNLKLKNIHVIDSPIFGRHMVSLVQKLIALDKKNTDPQKIVSIIENDRNSFGVVYPFSLETFKNNGRISMIKYLALTKMGVLVSVWINQDKRKIEVFTKCRSFEKSIKKLIIKFNEIKEKHPKLKIRFYIETNKNSNHKDVQYTKKALLNAFPNSSVEIAIMELFLTALSGDTIAISLSMFE